MAFTQIKKQRGVAKQTNTVTVSKSAKNGQFAVIMTDDIFKAIGSPRWVELFLGEGEDTGTFLVSPCESSGNGYSVWANPASPNQHKFGVAASRFGMHRDFRTTEATFEVTPEGLIITLPFFAAAEQPARRVVNRLQSAA